MRMLHKKTYVALLVIVSATILIIFLLFRYTAIFGGPTITSYENENLAIYDCVRPIKAKPGKTYSMIGGAQNGLVPADLDRFNTFCSLTGIE